MKSVQWAVLGFAVAQFPHAGAVSTNCSKDGDDCSSSGCCQNTANKCFKKNDHWSACNATCSEKRMWEDGKWVDTVDKTWDCEVITAASAAANDACSADGDDCTNTGCCKNKANKCFRKNEHWSSCNASCLPKVVFKDGKWEATAEKTWDCEVILPHQAVKAPKCQDPKNNGEDCSTSGCCAKKGEICFRKDEHHSSCNETCTPNVKWDTTTNTWVTSTDPVWDCTVVKPNVAKADMDKHQCTDPTDSGLDCTHTGCCKDAGATCFRKNKWWSACNATCNPNMKWVDGKWETQTKKVWDCAVVYPPRTPKVACANPVKDGENCESSGCCESKGSTCWGKTKGWASCMDRCWTNKKWENNQWVEKDTKIWDCDEIIPNATEGSLRLYEMADEAVISQPSVASRPLLAALALGVVAGGSIALFRRPQLREVPQEDSAEE